MTVATLTLFTLLLWPPGASRRAQAASATCGTDVSIAVDKRRARPGEIVTFRAVTTVMTTAAPDEGTAAVPRTYAWATTVGSLGVDGATATLDTTGLAGTITVSLTVTGTDDPCRRTRSTSILVEQPSGPVCTATWLLCLYSPNRARVGETCGYILDDAALRLRLFGWARLFVDGHASAGERKGIARARAAAARDYLVRVRRVDPSRVAIRVFDDTCPTGSDVSDRRVEVWVLGPDQTPDTIEKYGCPGKTGSTERPIVKTRRPETRRHR